MYYVNDHVCCVLLNFKKNILIVSIVLNLTDHTSRIKQFNSTSRNHHSQMKWINRLSTIFQS